MKDEEKKNDCIAHVYCCVWLTGGDVVETEISQ